MKDNHRQSQTALNGAPAPGTYPPALKSGTAPAAGTANHRGPPGGNRRLP